MKTPHVVRWPMNPEKEPKTFPSYSEAVNHGASFPLTFEVFEHPDVFRAQLERERAERAARIGGAK